MKELGDNMKITKPKKKIKVDAEEHKKLYGWCIQIYYSNIAGNNEKIREVVEDIAREWHTIE
jgi:hypothetical protein